VILGDIPPPAWSGQIDQIVFRAFGALNETIFFDRRSRTALFTDLMFNVNYSDSALTRIVLRLDGGFRDLAVILRQGCSSISASQLTPSDNVELPHVFV